MKVSKAHSWGRKTSTIVTFIQPSDRTDERPIQPLTNGKEFERRIRQAKRKPGSYVGPQVEVKTTTTYAELCAKYANEIQAGRAFQNRVFPKRG